MGSPVELVRNLIGSGSGLSLAAAAAAAAAATRDQSTADWLVRTVLAS